MFNNFILPCLVGLKFCQRRTCSPPNRHEWTGFPATRLARTFQALADPTRIRLISALLDKGRIVCDLAAVLGMSQSSSFAPAAHPARPAHRPPPAQMGG